MRLLFLLFFSGYSLMTAAQRKYHCEYKARVTFPMPDSVLQKMRKQIEDQGFSSTMAEQLIQQVELSGGYVEIVQARVDSTFILATNKSDYEEESNIKMNMPDQKYLYVKNRVFRFDSSNKQFVADDMRSTSRTFLADDNKKMIMGHPCTCYMSTDSSLKIWVAEDLPQYINPGLSIGEIKGALLAYELKNRDKKTTIRSEMARIE